MNLPVSLRGRGSQRCAQSNLSPCICAATRFLQEGKDAGTQAVAMESQEEERDQDRLQVPKHNIKKEFSDTQTIPPTS